MFPVIDQSVNDIAGYSNDLEAVVYPTRPYLIFGDHTQALKVVDFPFIQGADGIKILDFDEEVLAKYVFYLLKHRPMPSAGYRRHYSLLKEYEIPIPSLEKQEVIVNLLDDYFAVITGANQVIKNWVPQLEVRESSQLVRLGDVVQIDKQQGNYEGLPYVGLEDIEPKTGRFKGDLTPRKVKSSTYKFGAEHVLLGQLRPYLNKYLLPDFVGHCSTEIQPLLPSKTLKREFLAYWLSTKSREIDATSYGARMPRARMDQVLEMEIPIPSLEEQEYIVQHLKSEQATIHGLRSLIDSYEQLAEDTIAAIWE
jgi:restriction endonuclease S subunit